MADQSLPKTAKQCTKCGQVKPLESFPKRRSICKVCDYARIKAWAQNNAEKLAARQRERYHTQPENKAQSKARTYRWRAENPEKYREIKQAETHRRRARDKGMTLEEYQAWRQERRERPRLNRGLVVEGVKMKKNVRRKCPILRAYPKVEYQINREYYLAKCRAWEQANPDKALAKKQRRRARLAGCNTILSLNQWNEIVERFGGRCAYCGEGGKMTRDHVIPLSKGGDDSPENIVPACRSCNSRKGTGRPLVAVQTLLFA